MTFLNPAILWGLFAVSIPIIIHIFNLKKTRKIEFSTLMFLKEIQETKQKRIKLKQLLILLCRIAFIILLVMMFADPLSKGFLGAVNSKAESSVLILFDDSFSMSGRNASGTDLDIAKEKCSELLKSIDNSDEVFFVPASKINNPAYHMPVKNLSTLNDSIANIKVSDISKPVRELISGAITILTGAKYPLKEIYFITDGQGSLYDNNTIPAGLIDDDTRLSIILTSSRNPNNISIDSIDIRTKIFTPDRLVKFSVKLSNHDNFNVTGKSIIFTSGSYSTEKIIDLPAGTVTQADFSFMPASTGYISGNVELSGTGLSEDEFQNDNKRNIVFFIPGELKILLVSQNEADAGFVELALASSEALTRDSSGRQNVFYKIKKTNTLAAENLMDFNTVIIINKNSFQQSEADKLKEYIESGGGVIIYPGSETGIHNYNEVLFKDLGLPYLPEKAAGNTVFEKIDFEHPVFDGMFKSKPTDNKIESPQITAVISPQQGYGSQTLIKLSNGSNFLEQYSIANGKIFFYAVPPDNSWSDFPQKSIFPPLTVRCIQYSAKIAGPKEAITGKEYYIYPAEFEDEKQGDTILITASGKKTVYGRFETTNSALNLENIINTAGVYDISGRQKVYYSFPANTNPLESSTGRMNAKEIKDYFKNSFKADVSVFDIKSVIQQEITEARTGKMLWQYFLIGALLFLAAEYLLSKSIIKGVKVKNTVKK